MFVEDKSLVYHVLKVHDIHMHIYVSALEHLFDIQRYTNAVFNNYYDDLN